MKFTGSTFGDMRPRADAYMKANRCRKLQIWSLKPSIDGRHFEAFIYRPTGSCAKQYSRGDFIFLIRFLRPVGGGATRTDQNKIWHSDLCRAKFCAFRCRAVLLRPAKSHKNLGNCCFPLHISAP